MGTEATSKPTTRSQALKAANVPRWVRYLKTRSAPARDELVLSYLPLVRFILNKLSACLPPNVEEEDLLEVGMIGLIKAVEEYDPSMNTEFTTYAVPRVRGMILDELRAQDWRPRSARKRAAEMARAYRSAACRAPEPPLLEELAEELELDEAECERILAETRNSHFVSLDAALPGHKTTGGPGPRTTLLDSVDDPRSENPFRSLQVAEDSARLTDAVGELPYQEKLVVQLHYFEDLMLKEVARILRVSKSRVSQIHHRAIYTLRLKIAREAETLSGSPGPPVGSLAATTAGAA